MGTTMQRRLLPWLGALAIACGAGLRAQEQPAVDRLQQLLRDLATLDDKTWAARLQQLEQQAKASADEAAKLRAQATAIEQQAQQKDAATKKLRDEIEQLKQLQALAQKLPRPEAPAADKAGAAAPAAAPKDPAKEPPKEAAKEPAKTPMPAPASAPAKNGGKDASKDGGAAPAMAAVAATADAVVLFERDIAPVFEQNCVACHDASDSKGGLDLTSFAGARKGGGSGRTIVPGEPDQSRLFLLIAQKERPFMPKDADPLPAATVATIKRWIEQGAAEHEAAARAFAAERQQAVAAVAADAAASTDAQAVFPADLPAVAVKLPPRPAALKSIARSPRAAVLALPGVQQVLLFDAALHPLGALPCELAHVDTVGFSADGATLFAAGGEPGRSGAVVAWDVRTGAAVATCGSERDVPLCAAVDRAHDLVALGGSSKRARVLHLDGSERFAGKHDDFVLSLSFAADGALLAAGDRTGAVLVWETASGRLGQSLLGHAGAVNAVAFRGSKQVLSAGQDGTVRMWDVAAGKEQWRQNAHQGPALALALGPDDRVASCGSDGRIRVFTAQGKPVAQSPPVGDWLYCVAFGASGEVVFAGDWQGRLHCFELKGKKLSATVPLSTAQ